jgi:hypothetical protein
VRLEEYRSELCGAFRWVVQHGEDGFAVLAGESDSGLACNDGLIEQIGRRDVAGIAEVDGEDEDVCGVTLMPATSTARILIRAG